MAEKNNATCSICGKGYYMCISCKDMMSLSPWKKHTCTSEHYKVYQILHGYSTGVYSKDEAKSKLQMVDLSDFNSFRENIKNVINDIKKEDVSVIDIAVEVEDKSEVSDDTENVGVSDKPKMYRRKKSSETSDAE